MFSILLVKNTVLAWWRPMCYTSEGHLHWMDPSPNDTSPKHAPELWSWSWQSQEWVVQLLGCTSNGRDISDKLWLLHCGHKPAVVVKVPSSPRWPVVPGRAANNAWCVPARVSWWQSSAEGSGEHTASVFKWDSLIRLQLLHFTRRKLFIDAASFIYFLNAQISLVWSCWEI